MEQKKCWLCASSFKEESCVERIKGAFEKCLNKMLKLVIIKPESLALFLFSYLYFCVR